MLGMTKNIAANKKVIADLVRIKDDFNTIVESIELSSDKKFMQSYKRSKAQVRKQEFGEWNEL